MNRSTSEKLFAHAQQLMPGGVNSPVRAFRGVGGTPVFMRRGHGAFVEDVDGNEYIDYIGSWGPMILGHAHPRVIAAITEAAAGGTSFGCPTEAESVFAELIIDMVPSVEMVRLVSSGTEATLSAIRLARGFTGRPKLLKFKGCYHGHSDSLLSDAGSGVATLGLPSTPGVLAELAAQTITIEYNDFDALEAIFVEHGAALAAAIVEPVAGNMGCILPRDGYLERLRALCTEHGALLVFDEVMTGFRVARGGVQERWGVMPDLTTLGKVIGGGLPVGAYGGRRDIMSRIAPAGDIYQAGTLSGNPLAVAAGLTTLQIINERPDFYAALEASTLRLHKGLLAAAQAAGVPCSGHVTCGMFGIFITDEDVWSFADAKRSNTALFNRFFHEMLDRGIYLAPSAFEAGFVGIEHSNELIDRTIDVAYDAFAAAQSSANSW
jgi:glutamate-1-semialdehyde 2,1-aminomutase